MPSSFLTAEWCDLVMLNYEVDPAALVGFVPSGTELDSWNGRTLLSVVGFRFIHTRVLGLPIPFHRHFEEVNLRFYVRRRASDGWRQGVVFIKEIVPKVAVAWIARAIYNENYIALPMRHEVRRPSETEAGHVRYEWHHQNRWSYLTASVRGDAALPPEDSEETFITEHYWGYAKQRRGASLEYRVEHPRWRVWRAVHAAFDCDVASLYGPAFAGFLTGTPRSAFVADGSPVTVHRGVALSDTSS